MSDPPAPKATARFFRPLVFFGNNVLSRFGVAVVTAGAITLITFYTTEFFGVHPGPYTGILLYLIIPAVFVLGLLMIPAGILWRFVRDRRAGRLPPEYPRVDLRDVRLRQLILVVMVLTGVNLALFLTASYRGVHYMDSSQFCGQSCHTVMEPEFTAYQNSPHSRVECVECHIGSGADWFVKSKLDGAAQVWAVTFDTYPKPIPTPIESLRPARDTCERCHSPLQFVADRLVVRSRFDVDEWTTETKTVLLMKTGGIDPLTGEPKGNHGVHLQPGARIEYVAADRERRSIPYVRYTRPDGSVVEYVSDESDKTAEQWRASGPMRLMDCMDCHNRPAHTFELPGPALDEALAAGMLDRSLPFIKKQALELLQGEYASREAAEAAIRAGLRDPKSADAVVGIYRRNVFPKMKVTWGTYPNNLGHDAFPGCMRCHDGSRSNADGDAITFDCAVCHSVLATQEPDPEILKRLLGE